MQYGCIRHLLELSLVGWAVRWVVGQVLSYCLEHDPSLFSKESVELIVLSVLEYSGVGNIQCLVCATFR